MPIGQILWAFRWSFFLKGRLLMDAKKKNILTAVVLVIIAVAIYIFSVIKAMS